MKANQTVKSNKAAAKLKDLTPRKSAKGGTRMHKPFVITKELGKSALP
jgi:hypothetical protein